MVAYANSWTVKQSKVLSQTEIDIVLADLVHKAKGNRQALVRLVIFRLATFCGLRVTELTLLNLDDVRLDCEQPHIRIRAENSKGKKSREVPVFSEATVSDLKAMKALRAEMGAGSQDAFLVSVSQDSLGNRFSRQGARLRFQAACKPLGIERAKGLSIHCGRHTAISQLLAKSVPLAVVRDLAGHSSISVTNLYTNVFIGRHAVRYNLD